MQNAAPPERQSNADFFTQPAVQMLQWLMFIYSPVVNVQISALSLSSIKLVFLLTHWSSPWTPGYYWRELIPRRVSSMFFLAPDLHSLWSGHPAWCGQSSGFMLQTRVRGLQHLSHADCSVTTQLHSALLMSGVLVLIGDSTLYTPWFL